MTENALPSEPFPAEGLDTAPSLLRLEARLARTEAQLRTLADRIDELTLRERSKKQRALMVRLALLAILMGLFFVMQFMRGRP